LSKEIDDKSLEAVKKLFISKNSKKDDENYQKLKKINEKILF
jgi:hypothetical protein